MDLLRIAVRAAFAFLVLSALMRVSGKRPIKHGGPFDFVLSLIIGDMVDDLLWAEVPAATFVVAVTALVVLHLAVGLAAFRSGWRPDGL